MLGAIAGDIIGSVYEFNPIKTKNFVFFDDKCEFTDDTVLTVAIANSILTKTPYLQNIKKLGTGYPDSGYGNNFRKWLFSDASEPYNSYGNGSAMRVSPIAYAFESKSQVLDEAEKSAEITHNHPEGIKGAQATALAIYMARTGSDKDSIKKTIVEKFGYELNRTVDEIRPEYAFNETSQGSVPESIIAFLDSNSWDDAIRNAVSLGGDSDTMACIAGGIAEAYYKDIPSNVLKEVKDALDEDLWNKSVQFYLKHGIENIKDKIKKIM